MSAKPRKGWLTLADMALNSPGVPGWESLHPTPGETPGELVLVRVGRAGLVEPLDAGYEGDAGDHVHGGQDELGGNR